MSIRVTHVLWGLAALVFVFVASVGTMALLAVEAEPLLMTEEAVFEADQIFRAKQLLDENNPRTLKNGEVSKVVLSQADLNLALGYLTGRGIQGAAQVALGDGSADVSATLPLPEPLAGSYLNIQATLVETGGIPRFEALKIGKLPLPGFVGDWLVTEVSRRLQTETSGPSYLDLVKNVEARSGKLTLTYEWNEAVALQIKASVVPEDEQHRWQIYQTRLAELTKTLGAGPVSLTELLNPLLKTAQGRAVSTNAVVESRAVLVVLAAYLVEKNLDQLVPAAKTWPQPLRLTVLLGGRDDFPKHFAISAAMAAAAGTSFADAVGVYKEIKDTQGGSGFSFNDLAADRSGTRLGEASRSPGSAVRFLEGGTKGYGEGDFFPEVSDLPEFLSDEEFRSQYGSTESAEYRAVMDKIERRIAVLPLFR